MKFLQMLKAKRLELEAQRAEFVEAMEAVTETAETEARTELNEAESAAFDEARTAVAGLDTELDTIDARIAELEPVAATRASAPETDAPQIMRRTEVADAGNVLELGRGAARDQALALLETRSAEVDTAIGDRVESLVRQGKSRNFDGDQIVRRMLITDSDAYRSAWMKMVTQAQPVLTVEESRAMQAWAEFRAMNITTDTAGGFGVPVLIDPSIILTAQGSLNPFEAISRIETITTDAWRGVSSAGVTWAFQAESATVTNGQPTLAQPIVNSHMARGFIPYTIEVGGDYPGFASEMSTLLAEGFAELKAQKFAVGAGDGSEEPFGIFTALDANTNVEVAVTTAGTFSGTDINKVWGQLPDRFKQNATWVMSHTVGNEVASFGAANNLSFVTVDLTQELETVRQRPVEFASYAPAMTTGTAAANRLVVGDFRNYLIAQRAGMEVELVPHLFDVTNNRPTGERGWFAHARVGADSINDNGFRLLQN